MARIRTIKPEFWTDPNILSCSRDARLLFLGIWNFNDDNGNIEANSLQIKCLVYPADNINIIPLLAELEDPKKKLLIKYIVDGKEFYHTRTFLKHQRIDHPSKPKCPLYKSEFAVVPQAQEGELFDKKTPSEKKPKREPPFKFTNKIEEHFEEFWECYPQKLGKKRAIKHFNAHIKTPEDLQNLYIALDNYEAHLKKNPWKQPQHGDTFMNNHEDWIEFKESKMLSSADKRMKEAYDKRTK